jgi:UDP-N-acetylmuramoyl-L-alanyl-D-glutamate--2,6-diaminopimelate ligase
MMALRRAHHAWRLADLLAGFAEVDADLRVGALAMDTRRLVPGALFLACPGAATHGMAFADQASQRGALAIAAEPTSAWDEPTLAATATRLGLPVIPVPGLAGLASALADRFYGEPSAHVEVIGVAGARGKTSVSHFLAQALSRQFPCGVIGNVGIGFPDDLALTAAPDAVGLQETLAGLRADGAQAVTLGVPSSDPDKAAAVRLRQAVFTTLSRDLESRAAGPMHRLLHTPELTWAVLNADDPASVEVLSELDPDVHVALYGLSAQAPTGWRCDLWVGLHSLTPSRRGLHLSVLTSTPTMAGAEGGEAEIAVLGTFNAANLLAVLALLLARGLTLGPALHTLSRMQGVPGRMESFGGEDAPLVAVDYAHTPGTLRQAITHLRRHGSGRLITVFGCGGGHDRYSRALMGAAAEAGSDMVIVTDDNPRDEDGAAIVAEILTGMTHPGRVRVERSRGLAIRIALTLAGTADTVLIAGKGHETIQEIGEIKTRFSDRAQVVQALREWTGGRL